MREEKVLTDATLCFLVKEGKVLLAMKADKIGKGCWNGYGGGINNGESPNQSAIRELEEEADVVASVEDMERVAIVDFHNTKSDGRQFVCRVHVYLVRKWSGEPQETEEMLTPTWFEIDNLPFNQMMPADRVWLPYVLNGKKIMAKAHLGPFQKALLREVVVNQVNEFPGE